jgi:phosphohistidine phosphatase
MRLLLMRHGQAETGDEWPDHDRPLTDKGRADARGMGRWIAAHAGRPEVVRCSSALRVRQTWSAVARGIPDPPEPTFLRSIYLAGPDQLVAALSDIPDDIATVLVIGHNPTMQQVVAARTGESRGFPAGTVALLDVAGSWARPGRAHLVDLASP